MARTNKQLTYDKQLLVLTTSEDHNFLKAVAQKDGKSMGDIVRDLIKEMRNQQQKYKAVNG